MGRREFLRRSLVVLSAGIAGCGAFGGPERGTATYASGAADQVAVAVGALNKVALAIGQFRDRQSEIGGEEQEDGPTVAPFQPDRPRERIASAREALDVAAESADGDTQADVEAVRAYAEGVAGAVDTVVNVRAAAADLDEAQAVLEGEEIDTAAAEAPLDDATVASSDAQSAQEAGTAALESADGTRLAGLGAEYDAMVAGLETLGGYVAGVDGLSRGYREQVDGIAALQDAEAAVDESEFDAARSAFETAETRSAASASTFAEATDPAADDLVDALATGEQQSRALERLAGGYVALLDGRDHLKTADAAVHDDVDADPRDALADADAAVETASDRFDVDTAGLDASLAADFELARTRADSMDALVDGYGTLLDSRQHLDDGATAFRNDRFGEARSSFEDAADAAGRATTTFEDGRTGTEDALFVDEFDDAIARAGVVEALGTGYGFVVDGRQDLAAGRDALDDRRWGDARTNFDSASTAFAQAEAAFESAEGVAGDLYSERVATALCRARTLDRAATHLVAAAEAGSERDLQTFRDERDAAEQEIDAAEDC